jgi:quinohemoprotein ethanol dehydrogenase
MHTIIIFSTGVVCIFNWDFYDVIVGAQLCHNYCVACHGYPASGQGGSILNLGNSSTKVSQQLKAYVLNRALGGKGMPDFSGRLTVRDVEKLKAFIPITVHASIQ